MKLANDPVRRQVDWNGVPVDVEWPRGSTREYTDENGEVTFSKNMYCDYGYVRGTDSSDGEEMDVYLGNAKDADTVYVVDQLVTKEDHESGGEPGDHDEWKYMLGFESEEEAQKAYELHMTEDHFGGVYELPFDQFLEMIHG